MVTYEELEVGIQEMLSAKSAGLVEVQKSHCGPVIDAIVKIGAFSALRDSDEFNAAKERVCDGCRADVEKYLNAEDAEIVEYIESVGWTREEAHNEHEARRGGGLREIIAGLQEAMGSRLQASDITRKIGGGSPEAA